MFNTGNIDHLCNMKVFHPISSHQRDVEISRNLKGYFFLKKQEDPDSLFSSECVHMMTPLFSQMLLTEALC